MYLYTIRGEDTCQIGVTDNIKDVYQKRPGDEKYFWHTSNEFNKLEAKALTSHLKGYWIEDDKFQATQDVESTISSIRKFYEFGWKVHRKDWMPSSFIEKSEKRKDDTLRLNYYASREVPWGVDGEKLLKALEKFDLLLSTSIRNKNLVKDEYTITWLVNEVGYTNTLGSDFFAVLREDILDENTRIHNMLKRDGFQIEAIKDRKYLRRRK